jgi:hypothetical protein
MGHRDQQPFFSGRCRLLAVRVKRQTGAQGVENYTSILSQLSETKG